MNTAKIVLGEIIMLKMLIGLHPGLGFLGRGVPRMEGGVGGGV